MYLVVHSGERTVLSLLLLRGSKEKLPSNEPGKKSVTLKIIKAETAKMLL